MDIRQPIPTHRPKNHCAFIAHCAFLGSALDSFRAIDIVVSYQAQKAQG